MPDGGAIINGREYTKHALERMAPDTPSVRAELSKRVEEITDKKGFKPGTKEYMKEFNKYVNPRNIPPSVVEDTISSVKPVLGDEPGTLKYETNYIRVITDFSGKVVTVMPQ